MPKCEKEIPKIVKKILNKVVNPEKRYDIVWDCKKDGHDWAYIDNDWRRIIRHGVSVDTLEIPIRCEDCGKTGREIWIYSTTEED